MGNAGSNIPSQAAIRKTKAWNTGQLEGLDRSQTALEEEVEGIERSLASVRLELEDVEAAARAAEAKEEMEREDDPVVEEYEEDFHLWLSRAGGPSGGWTHDDHLVLTTLTHRFDLMLLKYLNLALSLV